MVIFHSYVKLPEGSFPLAMKKAGTVQQVGHQYSAMVMKQRD